MNVTRLGDVAEINPSCTAEFKSIEDHEIAFLPMDALGEDGSIRYQDRRRASSVKTGYTLFRRGDVLLAKITPCMENGKAAHVENLRTDYGAGSTEFHVLRPGSTLDGRFLFYLIWNPAFRAKAESRMTGSAGQKRVPAEFLRNFYFVCPSFGEQRRIAAILNKVDTIRRKWRQALAEGEMLEQSLFMEIVGPKAEGYLNWGSSTFEDLAMARKGAMRTGPFGSDLRHSEFVEEGVAVLGIDNAVQNRFAWGERRFITNEKYQKLIRYTVFPKDVIVTIMGTTGRSAVVPDDIPLAITTKHLATITPDSSKVESEFLSNAFHRHPAVLSQIAKANKGAIMDGLNLGIIKSLEVPLPPIAAQKRYVEQLRRVRSAQNSVRRQLTEADALFASLSQRAFRGEQI